MKLSVINTKAESQQRKLRVCAYVRVSSDKDAQMESYQTQKPILKGNMPKTILVILWVYFLMQEYRVQMRIDQHFRQCWGVAVMEKLI